MNDFSFDQVFSRAWGGGGGAMTIPNASGASEQQEFTLSSSSEGD